MDTPDIYDVNERTHYKFKKHPYKSMEDDPEGAFSQTPHGVLHVEDIRAYIHCKLELIDNTQIIKRLREMVEGIASGQAGAKPELPKATGAIKDSSEDVASEAEVPVQAKETSHNVTPVQTRRRSERAPTRKTRKVITEIVTMEASQAAYPTEKETTEKNKEEVEEKSAEAPKRVQWKPDLKMLAKRMLEQGKIN